MLPLALDLPLDHVLLLRVVDRREQVGPRLLHVVDARGAQGPQEGEDGRAVLDALRRVDRRDRPALVVVRREQLRARPPLVHGGDLVCQVVDVGQPRVEAQASCGWEGVGGITSPILGEKGSSQRPSGWIDTDGMIWARENLQKDVAHGILICNLSTQDPGSVTENVKGNIGTNSRRDDLSAQFFRPRLYWMFLGLCNVS